jgi:hypothetical protein
MERGRTDYILLVLTRKVMHSCHSFLATAPQSFHNGGAIQETRADTRDIMPSPRVFDLLNINTSDYRTPKYRG